MRTTLKANTKFVVIASACRANLSAVENMMRTADAHDFLKTPSVKGLELVTGFYHEDGQAEGAYEQSFMFGVQTLTALKVVRSFFCADMEQDCILVWNRDTNAVWLINNDGFVAELGNNGLRKEGNHKEYIANGWWLPNAFTVMANGDLWTVAP